MIEAKIAHLKHMRDKLPAQATAARAEFQRRIDKAEGKLANMKQPTRQKYIERKQKRLAAWQARLDNGEIPDEVIDGS